MLLPEMLLSILLLKVKMLFLWKCFSSDTANKFATRNYVHKYSIYTFQTINKQIKLLLILSQNAYRDKYIMHWGHTFDTFLYYIHNITFTNRAYRIKDNER